MYYSILSARKKDNDAGFTNLIFRSYNIKNKINLSIYEFFRKNVSRFP